MPKDAQPNPFVLPPNLEFACNLVEKPEHSFGPPVVGFASVPSCLGSFLGEGSTSDSDVRLVVIDVHVDLGCAVTEKEVLEF